MKYFTKEVRIALVAIVGVVVLFFGMNFLKGLNIFSSEYDYQVEFADITGLSSSSPVYADGFRVGVVKGIQYDYTHTSGSKLQSVWTSNFASRAAVRQRLSATCLAM